MTAELEAKRARLASIECELARLNLQHDLAMSGFKFDEARDVQQRIAVLERKRGELVDALPAPASPAVVRQRKLFQRRRRPPRRR